MVKFEVVKNEFRKNPNEEIQLPERGSKFSSGYDFSTPVSVMIPPKTSCLIWTDIKALMLDSMVLKLYVRSSIGIKKCLMLANQVGIIDSDYANNKKNDGNIGICLYNYGEEIVSLNAGDKIAQGIFEKYMLTDDDSTTQIRFGGIGSTDTKFQMA